ncbi:melanoma inhibitory activity protein 3-like protein, partial [Dinothrombium tinctorium]
MLCGDSLCKGVIAEAETLNRYPSRDRRILSFKQGEKVLIYAKPAYNQFKLVFAEINGRKGFVPFNLIREIKTTKRDLTPVALPRGISHIADEDKKAKTADENNNENRDNLIKGDSSSTAKDDINNSQKLAESRIGKGVPEDVQSLPNQDVQIDAKEQTKSETPVTDSQNKQTSDENKHIQKENSDTSTVDATNTQQNGNFSSGVTDIPTANSVNQDLEKMSKSEEETNSNNSANVEIETSTPSIVVNTSEVNDLRAENKGNEIESKTNDSKEESIQNSTQNSKEQEKEPTSASKETEEPSKEESIQNSTKNLK